MPSPESLSGSASSLTTALRLLRERWWVLALCVVLGGAGAVLNDSRKVEQYESTATLLFGTTGSNVSGVLSSTGSNVSADPQRDQSTTLRLVQSSSVADRVKAALRYPGPSSDLSAQVTASAQADANLIDVTATDPDPARAAQLANSFAFRYQLFRRDLDRAGLTAGIQALKIKLIDTPVNLTLQRTTLASQITALRIQVAATQGGVQIVDRATPSAAPASPRPKRDAMLGVILGLAAGAVIVFAFDLLDRRLKKVVDFEQLYEKTALVAVPLHGRRSKTGASLQAVEEPFRILRVSLGQASRAGPPHVVLVTSAVTGEGKSSTAYGLARAVAFSGQRVVLVELDLRRPTFHQRFDLPGDVHGTTGLLRGELGLEEVLVSPLVDLPSLTVIPAGGLPADSAELMSGPRMEEVLGELAERFDFVVLDAPPLLPVADTHALLELPEIDTCVVVGKPYSTTRDQARRARTTLVQHGRLRFGLVVNGVRDEHGSYDYGYGIGDGPSLREVLNQPIT